MNTTNKTYSPSINIIRDFKKELNYIPTPNAQLVFSQITNDFIIGIRSFSIIGAYGTGKSSFLWAFDKVVNHQKDLFTIHKHFQEYKGFDSINIVGDYASIIEVFAHQFKLGEDYTTTSIIQALDRLYQKQIQKDKGLIIYIDEFGKFLEYASKNNPEQELYFIQQLAEFVNDEEKNLFLITTLHQDFNSYSFGLTKHQRNEWSKVKGRLKEVTFNEPVEQLLYLASERLETLPNKPKKDKNFSKLFKAIKASKSFPLRDYFNEDIAEKLLPFDILAASLLTLALQKYGQNERSLFSFIESNNHLGIKDFDHSSSYFNISSVYDYLQNNFTVLHTRYNPHYTQWAAIKIAIERIEGVFEEDVEDALKIAKTIGLLSIFAAASARIDDDFLTTYGKLSLGIKNPSETLEKLEKHKIIRYVRHSQKFILFEGTDLDIEMAIDQAGNLVEKVTSVLNYLNTYFEFPYILAKAAFYKYGIPRFFEFKLTEEPIKSEIPKGEIDGFVNLVFSENLKATDIQNASKKNKEAIVYGWYKNTQEIRNLIFEIQKIKKVIENNPDDKVATRELKNILEHQIKLLNHYVLGSIYSDTDSIQWFFQGEAIDFKNQKEFNRVLSNICEKIYFKVPTYRSELVNKTKLSPAILTARKYLMRQLVPNWNKENIGFSPDAFPPQKTIYLSLIQKTGLLRKLDDNTIGFAKPTDESFSQLWEACEEYLDGAKSGKRSLMELIDLLSHRPFKLKKGFVDFWIPIFLFAKKEEFALFEKNIYVPNINDQVLEIVSKNPHKYLIKTFDIDGVNLRLFNQYRALLGQKEKLPSNQSFIETIKPFLTFYKSLPEYTKKTKRLTKSALKLREAITKAETPEKTFFEDFPNAFGYNRIKLSKDFDLLNQYIDELRQGIKEIRVAYDDLQDRFESCICDFLSLKDADFEQYRAKLQNRFKNLKYHFLQQRQKVFLQRVNSDLDRKHWLSAVCQACVGKTLQNISDSDEPLLFDRFVEIIRELDNLYELAKVKVKNEKDDFISVELLTIGEDKSKRIVRLPENKKKKVGKQLNEIESILGKDKDVNIAALTKLLNQLLKND